MRCFGISRQKSISLYSKRKWHLIEFPCGLHSPNNLVTMLEYCLVSGYDWWDLTICAKPGHLEAICERLTEDFNKQPPALQQLVRLDQKLPNRSSNSNGKDVNGFSLREKTIVTRVTGFAIFERSWRQNFHAKRAQISCYVLGHFEKYPCFCGNSCGFVFGKFREKWATFYSAIWSH